MSPILLNNSEPKTGNGIKPETKSVKRKKVIFGKLRNFTDFYLFFTSKVNRQFFSIFL